MPAFRSLRSSGDRKIARIETVGLISKGGSPLSDDRFIAASIDAVGCMNLGEEGPGEAFGIELKCAQSADWLSKADEIAPALGRVNSIHSGLNSLSSGGNYDRFAGLAPDASHRYQLLRHAAALKLERMLHAASSVSQIAHAVGLCFDEIILEAHASLLLRVRWEHLPWTMKEPRECPNFLSSQLEFARANEEFKSSCKKSLDLARNAASNAEPFPPAHYARLTIACLRNAMGKLGAGVRSMLLSHVKLEATRLRSGSAMRMRGFQTLALNAFLLHRALKQRSNLVSGGIASCREWKRAANVDSGSLKKLHAILTSRYFESCERYSTSSKRSSNGSAQADCNPRSKRIKKAYSSNLANSARLNQSLNHYLAIAPAAALKAPKRCALCTVNRCLILPNG